MTWLTRLRPPARKIPTPSPAPIYAVHSPQRGYFAPGGEVWADENRELAQAQCETCERIEGNYGWRVVPLRRRGVGPSEVKQ